MLNIQPPIDTMKLFVDDIRETPRGVWMRAYTVEEAINIIKEKIINLTNMGISYEEIIERIKK